MRLPLSWLRDFVDLRVSAQDLADAQFESHHALKLLIDAGRIGEATFSIGLFSGLNKPMLCLLPKSIGGNANPAPAVSPQSQ